MPYRPHRCTDLFGEDCQKQHSHEFHGGIGGLMILIDPYTHEDW